MLKRSLHPGEPSLSEPPSPSHRASPVTLGLALLLIAVGLLLPPGAAAEALRGGVATQPPGLVPGLWLLKAALVAHGVAILAVRRWLGPGPRPGQDGTIPLLPLLLLLAVGAALRLPGLGEGLWYDEIQTLVEYVRQPLGVLVTTFDSTNQHLLYSVAARLATVVLGEGGFALRLPAALFGVASLWAVVWQGRKWLPEREAWWAAAVLAVSYHHVWFSQNARGYTGLLLGTLVATGLFADLLQRDAPSPRRVWGYALAMALTVVTHVTALVVLAGHGLVWLWKARSLPTARRRWAPFAALSLAGTIAATCLAPVLPQLLGALGSSGTSVGGATWQRPGWFVVEAITGLVRGLPAGIVVVPLAAIVVTAGIANAMRRERTTALLMLLPMGIMAGLLLATGHNLWPRFFFFGAAFVVLWAVHGGFVVLGRVIPSRANTIGQAGLALVTVASLALLPRAWSPKQDYPAAVAWLAANAAAPDAIVATEMIDLPVNRWLGHSWPVALDAGQLAALESATATTWVVYTFPIRLESAAPDLWQRLESEYTVTQVIPASVGSGEIVIAARRAATP